MHQYGRWVGVALVGMLSACSTSQKTLSVVPGTPPSSQMPATAEQRHADPYVVSMRVAVLAEKTKNYGVALKAYQEAHSLRPNMAAPLAGEGRVYGEVKEIGAAMEAYEAALQVSPHEIEWLLAVGRLYATVGDTEKAAQSFMTALRENPRAVAAYNDVGVLLDRAGKHMLAATCYHKGLALSANDATLQHNLALSQKGVADEAMLLSKETESAIQKQCG